MKPHPSNTAPDNRDRAAGGTCEASPTASPVKVRPTRYGRIFLLILAAMLVGSINNNNNLGFLLTFLLGSVAFVSVFYTRRNLAGIELAGLRCQPVFAGERANFEIQVRKHGGAALAAQALFGAQASRESDLAAGLVTILHITVGTERRGLLVPGPLEFSTCYPFGLFRARVIFQPCTDCLVYPRPIAGPPAAVFEGLASGAGENGNGAGVDDFAGLKAYQPGDNLGQISWKAYSKGQGLLIKEFAGGAGRVMTLDWQALKEADLERKLSRLCALVLQAHRSRVLFGLRLPTRSIAPDQGENHLKTCLSALALYGLPGDGRAVRPVATAAVAPAPASSRAETGGTL